MITSLKNCFLETRISDIVYAWISSHAALAFLLISKNKKNIPDQTRRGCHINIASDESMELRHTLHILASEKFRYEKWSIA